MRHNPEQLQVYNLGMRALSGYKNPDKMLVAVFHFVTTCHPDHDGDRPMYIQYNGSYKTGTVKSCLKPPPRLNGKRVSATLDDDKKMRRHKYSVERHRNECVITYLRTVIASPTELVTVIAEPPMAIAEPVMDVTCTPPAEQKIGQ